MRGFNLCGSPSHALFIRRTARLAILRHHVVILRDVPDLKRGSLREVHMLMMSAPSHKTLFKIDF